MEISHVHMVLIKSPAISHEPVDGVVYMSSAAFWFLVESSNGTHVWVYFNGELQGLVMEPGFGPPEIYA